VGEAIGDFLPSAVGVAISPLPIVALVLNDPLPHAAVAARTRPPRPVPGRPATVMSGMFFRRVVGHLIQDLLGPLRLHQLPKLGDADQQIAQRVGVEDVSRRTQFSWNDPLRMAWPKPEQALRAAAKN
jgi:hypothetical protein